MDILLILFKTKNMNRNNFEKLANSSLFSDVVIIEEEFALVIKFKSTQSAQEWTLVNIYGPCQGDPRVDYTN